MNTFRYIKKMFDKERVQKKLDSFREVVACQGFCTNLAF